MNWTQKELSLLQDLKTQEALCIAKYNRYAREACDPELKQLFERIAQHEEQHLRTIDGMLENRIPAGYSPEAFVPPEMEGECAKECSRESDLYLCQDALSMEKHVSSVYDTAIFEFNSPAVRKTLNDIQTQEQWHGEQIYAYMAR